MDDPGIKILECLPRAPEREVAQGNLAPREQTRLQRLVINSQVARNHGCLVYDDHDGSPRIRINIDEAVQPYIQSRLFPRFANRRFRDGFAAIDISAREDPQSVTRLYGAADQDDLVIGGDNHGSDGDLRV